MSLRLRCSVRVFSLACLSLLMCSVAVAQDEAYPKFDLFAGYAWMDPGDRVGPVLLNSIPKGFGVAGTFNFNRYFGFSADAGGHWGDPADVGTIMFGPRLMFRNSSRVSPFVHGMLGLHRLGVDNIRTSNGLGVRAGGGFDISLTDLVAWRAIQADYLYGRHEIFSGEGTRLKGVEVRTGLVFRFAAGPPPPPLAASCSAQPASVQAGQPISVAVTAANIRQNHSVNYEFRSTGGQVQPSDNTARVDTTGLAPGNYTVTATATDPELKQGGVANCTASFTVQPPPPRNPPTISCSANPSTVRAGQPVTITCTGQSPDSRPLTYSFTTTGGRVSPQQNQATLDTAGLPAGTVVVTSTVTDDRGLSASTKTSVTVEVPPPPPQAARVNEIQFRENRRPARVDNEAKAILDDVALRLQREPESRAVLVGNFQPNERNGQQVARQRAVNSKGYLVTDRGIDASRIEVRTGDAGTRSVVIWVVPQGATFEGAGTSTFDESTIRPQR
ncbi:MAG: hypothetical protein AB7O65_11395 [Candidatus Korobacteraceae bacterium]